MSFWILWKTTRSRADLERVDETDDGDGEERASDSDGPGESEHGEHCNKFDYLNAHCCAKTSFNFCLRF